MEENRERMNERDVRRMGDWGQNDDGEDTAGEGKVVAHTQCERGVKLKARKKAKR